MGEVDHCGSAEQLQATDISIKPAALSQSLTNDTPGRKEVEGEKEEERKLLRVSSWLFFPPLLE